MFYEEGKAIKHVWAQGYTQVLVNNTECVHSIHLLTRKLYGELLTKIQKVHFRIKHTSCL